jgi:hypothetical protein
MPASAAGVKTEALVGVKSAGGGPSSMAKEGATLLRAGAADFRAASVITRS